MKFEAIFGDFFLSEGYVFRVLTNHHPDNAYIGYPFYQLENNKLTKMKGEKYYNVCDRFLKKVPKTNIYEPIIDANKIDEYFNCRKLGNNTDDQIFNDFFGVRDGLLELGIKDIGLTGSVFLKSVGFEVYTDESDIDFIIFGRENAQKLKSHKNELFNSVLESYIENPILIYQRRKKTTPYEITMNSAEKFEAKKSIGLFNGRHINITSTYKGSDEIFGIGNISRKNMGLVNTEIEVINNDFSDSVPGFLKVNGVYKDKKIEHLVSNFFFYCMGGEVGDLFDVKGQLIEETLDDKLRYALSLENWGNGREYYMNLK